jgi:hypothetical protein
VYAHDPRADLMRGFAFLKDDPDLADAEEQFRQALAAKDLGVSRLGSSFGKTVTVLLALTVAYEHRPDEARALGGPAVRLCRRESARDHRRSAQTARPRLTLPFGVALETAPPSAGGAPLLFQQSSGLL